MSSGKDKRIQEYIPVGCVPAAHWPYAGGGGVSLPGGFSLPGGSPWPGGLPAGGVLSLPGGPLPARGVSLLGGCSPCPGGFSLPETPPWTDAFKNITLAQLRCGR